MSMKYLLRVLIGIGFAIALWSGIQFLISAPATFPTPYQLTVIKGQTLFSISKELVDDGALRYPRLFEMILIALGSERTISEGEYYFARPVSVVELALRMSGREFGIERTRVTFPEGFTNKQIAERLAATFPGFDALVFLTLAKGTEGYLFPDTYRFFPSVTPEFVVSTLSKNFTKQTESLEQEIVASGRSKSDIVIMASIIEKEARGDADRAMISGILWKRLDAGIALQVDAPFLYILGKESSELTRADLAMNSPYNTYRNKGLTPTPIGNPGLASIIAAIRPQPSPYLYYLHDTDGNIYYAATYDGHKDNIAKYLD